MNVDNQLLRDGHMNAPDNFARLDWSRFGFRLHQMRASARPDRSVGFLKQWVCEERPCLDLWHLTSFLYVLDLRHVDLDRSLSDLRFENVPNLFDDLCWPWHVDLPVEDLRSGHLDNALRDL